ncbi:hypothetical protein ACH4OX_12680 [Streptomyces roseolus]|uniref:hypothetical protein n=1 Tax=Streptomyces roseolus TaxID=67358 RepID=UPI0037AE5752
MGESVSVRCPECLRSHTYAAPAFPCACGTPVAPPVVPDATAEPVRHRTWQDEWVTVRCGACGREGEWPHPELGCACGTVLRIPVAPAPGGRGHGSGQGHGSEQGYGSARGHGAEEAYGPGRGHGPEEAYGPGQGHGPVPHVPDDSAGPGQGHGPEEAYGPGQGHGPEEAYGPGQGHAPEEAYGPGQGHGPVPHVPDDSAAPGPLPYPPDGSAGPGSAPYAPDAVGDGPADDGSGLFATLDDEARGEPGPVSDWFGAPPRSFAERYPAHITPPPTVPSSSPGRGVYRPVTIRTARDAVAAAATYLHWLGFREIVQPEDKRSPGVDLRGPGLVAQVDPSTRPAGLRAVECLWLNGLSASAVSVFFSLAGYTPEARSRAAEIRLPLFVLDLTGTPQPVNDAADELTSGGAV